MFEFRTEDLEQARRIVRALNIPKKFGAHDDSDDTADDISMQLEDVLEGDYFVSNGVSKLVIIADIFPFVIKIPFNGHWEYDGYEEEDYFCEFNQAGGRFWNDYCALELELTRKVKDSGFGRFVPDMMYLCTVCGRDVYVQEKVRPMCETYGVSPSAGSYEKARKTQSPFSPVWLGFVFDLYGENVYQCFMQWAHAKCDAILSDMHTGNYGFDMEGHPVLFDISGFWD